MILTEFEAPARNDFHPAEASLFAQGSTFSIARLENGAEVPGQGKRSLYKRFSIAWITRGSAEFGAEGMEHAIGQNQLVCMGPETPYRLDPGNGAKGYIIQFTESFLSADEQGLDISYQGNLARMFAGPGILTVRREMVEEMELIAGRMVTEFENIFLYKNQILRRYLKIFLIYLSRHEVRKEEAIVSTGSAQLVQKFMGLLEKDYKMTKSVNEYARQLSVTPNYLNVVVKKCTRYAAGYHIRHRVILEAKRLAIYSDMCMKEIAYLLGFADTAHFSKFFKKSTGVNFSEFKKAKWY